MVMVAHSKNLIVLNNKMFAMFIIDPLDSDFDSIYMAATYLTPAYRGILDTFQTEQAKDFLLYLGLGFDFIKVVNFILDLVSILKRDN